MVRDGIFSIDGLAFGFSTFSYPSSQSEELHQQYVSPHLSQNLQYLPRNLLLPACSSSFSVWGAAAAYLGSVKTWGGIPESLAYLHICFWCCVVFCMNASYFSVGYSPLSGSHIVPPASFFPSMIFFCSSVGVLEHTELSLLGLDLYLYF